MPYTVWGAFDKFRADAVDLKANQSNQARSNRDYLFNQLKSLCVNGRNFPKILAFIPYGSFARKTKIRPLDDIDMLIILDGRNTEPAICAKN
jgi:UTP:GlnB (protein PII) uridylyltransferase